MTSTIDSQALLAQAQPFGAAATAHAQQSDQLLASLSAVQIDTSEQLTWIVSMAQSVARYRDTVDAERKSAVGALTQVVSQINGWFRPSLQALEAVERRCKDLIGGYHVRQRAEQERAFAAASAAMASGDLATTTAALAESRAAAPMTAALGRAELGAGVREVWRAEVVDANLVPREYLIVDQKALDGVAKKLHKSATPPSIAGVRFVRGAVVALSRKG
jgi:hypothetical protein